MGDITLMRGYGFPKGSRMDYAGYAGYGAPRMMRTVAEPSIFAKIPALDGLGEDFGSEYTFEPRLGEGGTLPTYHAETDTWEDTPAARPSNTGALFGAAAVGVGLWLLFGR